MEFKTKNNSKKAAPKGKIPAMIALGPVLKYQIFGGICLGIGETETGFLQPPCLIPMNDPKSVKGTLIKNHRATRANKDPNGTAPEDPETSKKKLRRLSS